MRLYLRWSGGGLCRPRSQRLEGLYPAEARTETCPAAAPSLPTKEKAVQQAAPRGRTEGTGQRAGTGTERCGPPGAAADGSWAEQGSLAASSLCSTFSA